MIVVTGAAGFIGSCIVCALNQRGIDDLFLVDHLEDGVDPLQSSDEKSLNLKNKRFKQFCDKNTFLELIKSSQLENIDCIIHMGACSSTTLQDADYFKINNLEYSRTLAQWAVDHGVRFIYASSAATYGDGSNGYKDDEETIKRCRPLNLYGQSKQDFDLWALENDLVDKVVGLRFFNVFGPNEYHKKDMRSVVAKAFSKVNSEGKMCLFKSYKSDFADGEQKRDFIYVKDAVDVVMFFFDNPDTHGIFNVGTGAARTWNDLANALFQAVGKSPTIEYVDMPDVLKNKYQYFTEADMSKLKGQGYQKPFTKLEDAVSDYVAYLNSHQYM